MYPSWYKSRLYPNQYKRDKSGNNKMLVTILFEVWLKVKDELRLILESMSGSRNYDIIKNRKFIMVLIYIAKINHY